MIPTIYIPICDDTLWILKLYAYLFNKYWGEAYKVVILGYKEPEFELPSNFEFVSMAEKQRGGSEGWSKHLFQYFDSIDDEHIIFTLEDFLPADYPNITVIKSMIGLMEINESIGRFDLTWDLFTNCPSFDSGLIRDRIQICEIPKGIMYRVSCQPAIWKRSFLVEVLSKTTNPWNFEMYGSTVSDNLPERVLGIKDYSFNDFPTKWVAKGAVSRHHPDKINVLGLSTDCIRELVEKGLLEEDKLQWGQWAGEVPSFHELGGYDFDIEKMPNHPASPSNWKEWYSTYK